MSLNNLTLPLGLISILSLLLFLDCEDPVHPEKPKPMKTRVQSLPADAVKMTPDDDLFPPILHNNDWHPPVPMPGPINTAGAEDSPFITPDGNTFFFFFTPDVRVPPNGQLFDGVTGIWWCHRTGDSWTEPERIILNEDISLDGAAFVQGDTLWFASARVGNYGEIDVYTAVYKNGKWQNWRNAGAQLNKEYDIGEFHLSADGRSLYFHGYGHDGYGDLDLWKTERIANGWSQPVNLGAGVNDSFWQGWPYLSQDGEQLWFCGQSRKGQPGPAIYCSRKQADGSWGPAEEIVSSFAGEPSMDEAGNLYFVHHFFNVEGQMLEADIYIAEKK